jgi:hypothetical protein
MNDKIKELVKQAIVDVKDEFGNWIGSDFDKEKFAKLIIQDCADYVRESYDHEAAESIAWNMEIKYGLHGDYA